MMLWRSAWRYLGRHRWLLLLSLLGVALGVAVVVAIDLANSSALRAFRLSSEALSGRATHQIVGGPRGVPETLYRDLRLSGDFEASAPVVEGYARVSAPRVPVGDDSLHVLGVDILAAAPFIPTVRIDNHAVDWTRLLLQPATGVLGEGTAQRLGVGVGSMLHLLIGGRERTVTVVGVLPPAPGTPTHAMSGLLLTDIATAQELFARQGYLSYIDLIVPHGVPGENELRELRTRLPPGITVVQPSGTRYALEQMTAAFRLNLTALSLLALVVGTFLIYNTMTFAVLQRRTMIGTLRALGVTRGELYRQILGEALLIGVCGTALGMVLGVFLGEGLLRLVTRTINDLYFTVQVSQLHLTGIGLAKGAMLGVGATVAAAMVPAWEATRTPPRAVMNRSVIEGRMRRALPWSTLAGALVLLGSAALLLVPTRSLAVGFAVLFGVIAGAALLVPALVLLLSRALRTPLGWAFGIVGRMAARGVAVSLSRTGVAIAALAVAVAATVGVGIMIDSFRHTVAVWLEGYLRADVFISAQGNQRGLTHIELDPRLVERFAAVPGVRFVSVGRRADLQAARGIVQLFALQIPPASFSAFRLKDGDPARARDAFFHGDGVLVTEPYAYHNGVRVGDSVRLRTDRGPHDFKVVGIYYDYGSEHGYVTMSRTTYERYWNDRSATSLGIYVRPGTDVDALIARLRREAAGIQDLQYFSNRELRRESLAIFDRTFAVTNVLRLLAIVVAVIGILSALMAIQLERQRELAVLRANGLTPLQVWGLVCTETGLMGLLAGLLALPLGIVLSLVLILVINRRSFGWSMQVLLSPEVLVWAVALALGAALLAGLFPAWRMARVSPALALREE